jgi:hypothetical protein
MRSRSCLRSVRRALTGDTHQQRPPKKLARRLALESLEDRNVPSIVFNPHFGPQTAHTSSSGLTLNSAPVYLIFWGQGWGSSTRQSMTDVQDATNAVLSSPYLSLLGQYRSDGQAHVAQVDTHPAGTGPAFGGTFTKAQLKNLVSDEIDNGFLPESDATGNLPIYLVVTPGGVSPSDISAVGYHLMDTDTDITPFGLETDQIPIVWAGTSKGSLGLSLSLDAYTNHLSHEMAEIMSDPDHSNNPGTTVTASPRWVQTFGRDATEDEIADNEPSGERYGYRLNGVWVQPYWVQTYPGQPDGAYIVPTATQQDFFLDPHWGADNSFLGTYDLTVKGDQLGPGNDAITIDTSSTGGVVVTLNGETATFDSGVINSITVRPGAGNNTINIEHTLDVAQVTIKDSGGSDTVNISPGAELLDNIQGDVTINGDGRETLTVNDQNDQASNTFTITSSTVKRDGSALITYSGLQTVTVNGGGGTVIYNVTSSGTPLTIKAGGGDNTVALGTGNLDDLPGPITVNGQGGTVTVGLDDHGAPFNETYTITGTTVSRLFFGGLTYSGITALTLTGASNADTYDVQGTQGSATTTLLAGSGSDVVNVEATAGPLTVYLVASGNPRVNVSPTAQDLGNIQGPVTVNGAGGFGTLNVSDAAYTVGDTYTILGTTLSVQRLPGFALTYGGINSLSLTTGSGNDQLILDLGGNPIPPGGLSLDGGDGSNSLVIQGQTDFTLESFLPTGIDSGQISLGTGFTMPPPLVITCFRTQTISDTSGPPNRPSLEGLLFEFDAADRPDVINIGAGPVVNGYRTTQLSGGGTYPTLNIAHKSAVSVNAGSGGDTITVGGAANTLGVITVPYFIHGGRSGSSLTLNDQGNGSAGTYTLTATTFQRTGGPVITYAGINALTVNTATLAGVINVQGTAQGTTTLVHAGAVGDTVNVGNNANVLDDVRGALTLRGTRGDTLSFNDQGATAVHTNTLDATTYQRQGAAQISYALFHTLNLNAGSNDRLTVQGTAPGGLTITAPAGTATITLRRTSALTSTTVNAGRGDTVTVGMQPTSLDSVAGPVAVNGQGGAPALVVNDQAGPAGDRCVLTASAFSRPNFGGLTYGGIGALTINAATAEDPRINALNPQRTYVLSTAAGVSTTINAADGWHNIYVGLPTSNDLGTPGSPLDGILGPVTVVGQAHQDNVTLDDSASTAQKTYTLNATSIRPGAVNGVTPAAVSWQGLLSTVTLFGSSAADTYQLRGEQSGLAALVVDGARTANTFQSFLPNSHTWAVYPNEDVSTGTAGHATNFGEVWNLTGGPGGDVFRFLPSHGRDGGLSGVLDGGVGGTLDYSQDASPVTVNLADRRADNLDGRVAGGFTNILHVIGNGSSTTLAGPATVNYWNVTGTNQGNLGQAPHRAGSFTFSAVPNLTGGAANDVFQLANGAAVRGVLDGGGGTNTLDYSPYATGVAVDLTGQNTPQNAHDPFGGLGSATGAAHVRHVQNVVGTRFADTLAGDDEANVLMPDGGRDVLRGNGGDDTFRISGAQDPGTVVDGGAGTNTLWAADFANTWDVTGQGAGSVRGTVPGFVSGASFRGVENLLGGASTDTFRFTGGAGVGGWVNGNAGVNTLDYTAYTTPVTVNLSQFGTWGRAMNAPLGVMHVQVVLGSRTAVNALTGSNIAAGVLVGGAANDVLAAGAARAVLIGGRGADVLRGGPADDLLIGGSTAFDANAAALMQVLAEWQSADSFSDRVNFLSGVVVNPGHYGGPTLHLRPLRGQGPTVFDDGSTDTVSAGGGTDWIIPS